MSWLFETLKHYPEISIFLALGFGYWIGGLKFGSFSLGAVTATLIVAVIIGQIGITISPNVKSVFFLMFLFAVGYGVGPQFVRGISKDGAPQALFSVVQAIFSLVIPYFIAKFAGYDAGAALGFYAGSQTISASIGLGTDAINRLGLDAAQTKAMFDNIPVAYAVTYIFGTIGSAILLGKLGPTLLGINLEAECKRYEQEHLGGGQDLADTDGTAWHQFEFRAYLINAGDPLIGRSVGDIEAAVHEKRIFIERIRRNGKVSEVTTDTVIQVGDVLAVAGARNVILQTVIEHGAAGHEVDDPELLAIPVAGVDVYVSKKIYDNKTLKELAQLPFARGLFVKKIARGVAGVGIPVLPNTKVQVGDILTLVGRTGDINRAAQNLGRADKHTDITDVATVFLAVAVGALIGAVVLNVANVPLTLSTAGGALIAGLVFGWYRATRPTFGYIPSASLWFMNSVGLNVFIAVVGISSGPGFVRGLEQLGFGIFLWGIAATSLPLILGVYTAKSQVPGLGYTVTYAVGNTFLTVWGMILVMMLS